MLIGRGLRLLPRGPLAAEPLAEPADVGRADRQLDQFLQSQLRTETSGGAYADQISGVLAQLQSLYGTGFYGSYMLR